MTAFYNSPDGQQPQGVFIIDPATGQPAAGSVSSTGTLSRAYSPDGLTVTETASNGTDTYTRTRTLRTAYQPDSWLSVSAWAGSTASLPNWVLTLGGDPLTLGSDYLTFASI